ncbi:MAG: 4Fe-4S binding protein [Desulfosarcinaceae bacterium]
MKIITTRRISQLFFFTLFLWFCVVSTLGEQWWQLRGWPVNWLMQLDPLNGLGMLLATHSVYAGLLWGVLTIALTLVLGRVFCGWICPLGAVQQFAGYLGKRGLGTSRRADRNQPQRAQMLKYWILVFLLAAALPNLLGFFMDAADVHAYLAWGLALIIVAGLLVLSVLRVMRSRRSAVWTAAALAAIAAGTGQLATHASWPSASLQIGLLDPLALIHRSFNLVLLPLADKPLGLLNAHPRVYAGAGLIGIFFLLILMLSLRRPRFYCRYVCPTGALLGLLSRWAVWRVGKTESACRQCRRCEADCEGACAPQAEIRIHECVLCLNCRDRCNDNLMVYAARPSAAGERRAPDLGRRRMLAAAVSGAVAIPMLRMDGLTGVNWNPEIIRPPGALEETAFLTRCLKCGQCMRVCPTNVIHPAGLDAGLEGLWTPVLKYRLGTSGCQYNCVACSHVCPTAAIRPLTPAERQGTGAFAAQGPVRLGTAFVDHGRCLPWAMDTPCIVCQENCPVSPKAIFTREQFHVLPGAAPAVRQAGPDGLTLEADALPAVWSSGDYFCKAENLPPRAITGVMGGRLILAARPAWPHPPQEGGQVQVLIRLQQPSVDPHRCIGCGVCEHECPVQGRRAIRVPAENETRSPRHRLTIR